jgi:uncharacterized protein YbaR (Trm112 family)
MTHRDLVAVVPDDAAYVVVCPDCRTSLTRDQDCPTTRAARSGEIDCEDCGTQLELVVDDGEANL